MSRKIMLISGFILKEKSKEFAGQNRSRTEKTLGMRQTSSSSSVSWKQAPGRLEGECNPEGLAQTSEATKASDSHTGKRWKCGMVNTEWRKNGNPKNVSLSTRLDETLPGSRGAEESCDLQYRER